jgi:HSP20 family protein
VVSDLFGDLAPVTGREARSESGAAVPAVDVREDAQRFQVIVDLPGVEEKDLALTVKERTLELEAKREVPEGGFSRRERFSGHFRRTFALPPTVDGEHIGAELKAGVLTLTLPKKREAQPRHIKVTSA